MKALMEVTRSDKSEATTFQERMRLLAMEVKQIFL